MHSPFTPVPSWLDPTHRGTEPKLPAPETAGFPAICFDVLYRLRMTDRQVVELTSLLICLAKKNRFHVPFHANEPSSSYWYIHSSKFYRSFNRLNDKVLAWVEFFLPKSNERCIRSQTFWTETKGWNRFFLEDVSEFDQEVERTRNKLAQMFFDVKPTGIWDQMMIDITKRFQNGFPKNLMPWKKGYLDGFTFKFMAKAWRKRRGIEP